MVHNVGINFTTPSQSMDALYVKVNATESEKKCRNTTPSQASLGPAKVQTQADRKKTKKDESDVRGQARFGNSGELN
jgi:hypothetical protein